MYYKLDSGKWENEYFSDILNIEFSKSKVRNGFTYFYDGFEMPKFEELYSITIEVINDTVPTFLNNGWKKLSRSDESASYLVFRVLKPKKDLLSTALKLLIKTDCDIQPDLIFDCIDYFMLDKKIFENNVAEYHYTESSSLFWRAAKVCVNNNLEIPEHLTETADHAQYFVEKNTYSCTLL